ncbi:MAG: hypothetical protein HY831_00675 [Candidatus Aenigmarchaeota archaeon]|nr:hypothetical protein [Candidatus Aenigmarchaeota archaeon]
MAVESIIGLLPLTISGVIWLLLKTLLIFVALVLSDKVLSHEMNTKHILIMAFLVAFIVPIIVTLLLPYIAMPAGFGQILFYGLPLLMWIVFGEVLLGGDFKEKITVAFIAFAIFTALDLIGIQAIIMSFIPF